MNVKKIKKQLRLSEEPDAELLALLEGIEDRPAKVHPSLQITLETMDGSLMPPTVKLIE